MKSSNIAKAAVVVNPASANGKTGREWPKIASLLRGEGLVFESFMTGGPGEGPELARQALQRGCRLVVAVGGDGTVNEVVNGFFTPGGPIPETAALGFIPSGTGNDLADTLGIPRDHREAVKHLMSSPTRQIDLGKIRFAGHDGNLCSRYFVNVAGVGLDGETVARVNRTSKALGGFVSFLWGTVIALLLYRNREMEVRVDGRPVFTGPVTMAAVGNGRFFGGGMCIAPRAVMDDGLLDIVIVHNMSKPDLLRSLPRVYRGAHLSHPKVKYLSGRKVVIDSPGGALLNLDGEQPGRAPVEIELAPRALIIKG